MSIYKNGSIDQTRALHRIFGALVLSVGLRVTSAHLGARVERSTTVSNILLKFAMLFLWPLSSIKSKDEYFDAIIVIFAFGSKLRTNHHEDHRSRNFTGNSHLRDELEDEDVLVF